MIKCLKNERCWCRGSVLEVDEQGKNTHECMFGGDCEYQYPKIIETKSAPKFTIYEAIKAIKKECKRHQTRDDCEGCLYLYYGGCLFFDAPYDWDMRHFREKMNG